MPVRLKIQEVMVVPILAPIMMPTAWFSFMMPEFTNPTTRVIRNLRITSFQPDMHELTVVKTGPFYADFQLDAESNIPKLRRAIVSLEKGIAQSFSIPAPQHTGLGR